MVAFVRDSGLFPVDELCVRGRTSLDCDDDTLPRLYVDAIQVHIVHRMSVLLPHDNNGFSGLFVQRPSNGVEEASTRQTPGYGRHQKSSQFQTHK
jgi:hypothetical protein